MSNIRFDAISQSHTQLIFDVGQFELFVWVLDRSGSPVAKAGVELTRADGYGDVKRTSRRPVELGERGRFRIPRLAIGANQVVVS